MFGKLFGKRDGGGGSGGDGRAEAVAALQILDQAIRSIHPERYFDPHDAAMELQPRLVSVNTFLGRQETERFFPVEYEAIIQRLDLYRQRNLLATILETAKEELVLDALLQGAMHEYWLRHHERTHNATNLGREVRASTLTLIDFLDRGASTKPEPMPR